MATNNTIEIAKKSAAVQATSLLQNNGTIGIGSGSTVYYFIEELGKKVREGFQCRGVATSEKSHSLAIENGITMIDLNNAGIIDTTIDGADEIDNHLQLIKGGGGALLREKMVAAASRQLIIIADDTKRKPVLGAFPLPLEVIPYGWKHVYEKIKTNYNIDVNIRKTDKDLYMTDNGNYILDCHFHAIANPASLNISLHLIPGVVETGLFIDMASIAVIGFADGHTEIISGNH